MDFQPMGLLRRSYNNGETIKWEVPGTKYAIFEWNMRENKNATEPKPHYHVMTIYDKNKHNDKIHYFPGKKFRNLGQQRTFLKDKRKGVGDI